jgi:hypothetical protein
MIWPVFSKGSLSILRKFSVIKFRFFEDFESLLYQISSGSLEMQAKLLELQKKAAKVGDHTKKER